MTSSGYDMLQEELKKLINKDRPNIIAAIAEARSHGDLSENAEYQYAKEEQGFIEGRIVEIGGKLSNSQVIDVTTLPKSGKVIFGTTVKLLNVDTDEEVTYQIVGDDEADIKIGKISVYSPIARALVGKSIDDVAIVKAPNGDIEYEICSVEYI